MAPLRLRADVSASGMRLAIRYLIPKLTDQNPSASWIVNICAVRPDGIGFSQWVLVLHGNADAQLADIALPPPAPPPQFPQPMPPVSTRPPPAAQQPATSGPSFLPRIG